MWENSYLHHFSLQVSQIVFLTYMIVLHKFSAFLTALTLITTVWVKILENSYQRDFSLEVS